MIRHGNRIFNRAFRQATPKLFVKQRAVASITLNPSYARSLTLTSTQIPASSIALLQSSPLSFIETLEGSISSSSSSSSLAVQADEEEDGEEVCGCIIWRALDTPNKGSAYNPTYPR